MNPEEIARLKAMGFEFPAQTAEGLHPEKTEPTPAEAAGRGSAFGGQGNATGGTFAGQLAATPPADTGAVPGEATAQAMAPRAFRGLTFGWGPKLMAAAESGLQHAGVMTPPSQLTNGMIVGHERPGAPESMDQALARHMADETDAQDRASQQEGMYGRVMPTIADVVASLPTTMAVPVPAPAATAGMRALQGAGLGAGFGALRAAGDTRDVFSGQGAADVGEGAIGGAALGGGLTMAAESAASLPAAVTGVARGAGNRLTQMFGGPEGLETRINRWRLGNANLTPVQIRELEAQGGQRAIEPEVTQVSPPPVPQGEPVQAPSEMVQQPTDTYRRPASTGPFGRSGSRAAARPSPEASQAGTAASPARAATAIDREIPPTPSEARAMVDAEAYQPPPQAAAAPPEQMAQAYEDVGGLRPSTREAIQRLEPTVASGPPVGMRPSIDEGMRRAAGELGWQAQETPEGWSASPGEMASEATQPAAAHVSDVEEIPSEPTLRGVGPEMQAREEPMREPVSAPERQRPQNRATETVDEIRASGIQRWTGRPETVELAARGQRERAGQLIGSTYRGAEQNGVLVKGDDLLRRMLGNPRFGQLARSDIPSLSSAAESTGRSVAEAGDLSASRVERLRDDLARMAGYGRQNPSPASDAARGARQALVDEVDRVAAENLGPETARALQQARRRYGAMAAVERGGQSAGIAEGAGGKGAMQLLRRPMNWLGEHAAHAGRMVAARAGEAALGMTGEGVGAPGWMRPLIEAGRRPPRVPPTTGQVAGVVQNAVQHHVRAERDGEYRRRVTGTGER